MRRRPESVGRLAAAGIPEEARVVALVYPPGDAELAVRAAEAVATAVARRREHTLLACLGPPPAALERRLGSGGPGLHEALGGRARLTEVARRPDARPFVYLPPGEAPPSPGETLGSREFADFASRVRRRGGTLLVLMPLDALDESAAGEILDGYLALGDVVPPSGAPPELARVEAGERGRGLPEAPAPRPVRAPGPEIVAGFEAETGSVLGAGAELDAASDPDAGSDLDPGSEPPAAPDADMAAEPGLTSDPDAGADPDAGDEPEVEPAEAAAPGEPPDGEPAGGPGSAEPAGGPAPAARSWRRHRKEVPAPLLRAAAGVGVVLVLVVGWWLFARGTASAPEGTDAPAAAEAGARLPAAADARVPTAEGAAGGVAGEGDGTRTAGIAAAAPELPYSVLIASYASREDAEERLAGLRGREGGPFFLAPTPVRGALYWRVFAGARPDAATGSGLMEDLVGRGLKDEEGSWHVRPARLAFRVGTFEATEAAERALGALTEEEVPAYLLPAVADRDTAWVVWAGAYESEASAAPLRSLLEEAGREAELLPRRGSPTF